MKEYSLEDFTKQKNFTTNTIPVKVDGTSIETSEGNKQCVYYQLLDCTDYSDKSSRRFIVKISQEPFFLIIDDKYRVKIEPTNTLRLFTTPYIVKEVKKTDEVMQTRLYCLEKSKTYYVRIQPQEIEVGPPKKDGTRHTQKLIFANISDTRFKDEPELEESPAFKDYIYG